MNTKYKLLITIGCFIVLSFLIQFQLNAQTKTKEVNIQSQSWVSENGTFRFSKRFGMIADLHMRRNNFLADPGFYFVRTGLDYWINENITAILGYGQMWVAPSNPAWHHFVQEHRIYQQLQQFSKIGKIIVLNRIRNEQRWQEKIVNDKFTHDYKFTDRVRYLLSFTIPVADNKKLPSLVLSDELAIQFGKEVVYNTFDQNRFFIGIKQPVCKTLSFDLGYMLFTQEKSTGYQYDKNNTLRCFFYYTPDFRKKTK
ncbi:DUF2490 domain-containing protein [Ferruginibacter paludis]|uniref:DUF2490 domain-containing protein n=1 Tax=Ferruginibacter paludis TaxID=1310417 RepID=UPI0025B5A6C7|nr:DUF2490 domain-containing protein [Ferruginibacter paludis]MDN3654950.1 DUF2490 domain-containing protein [Ferruginibacter paludis]